MATISLRRWGATSVAVVARSYLWCCVALLAWGALPAAVGLTPYSISSGSMEPLLRPGDVVLARPAPPDDLRVGQIVTIDPPGSPGGSIVTHRIDQVETAPDGSVDVRTRGDANASPDPPVAADRVEGTVRLVVPLAGLPGHWVDERQWWTLGAWAASVLLALGLSRLDTRAPGVASPRAGRRRRGPTSTRAVGVVAVVVGVAVIVETVAVAEPADASFTSDASTQVQLSGAAPLHSSYVSTVDSMGPAAHWRLGEAAADPVVLVDGGDDIAAWSDIDQGRVEVTTNPVRSGATALRKTANNDPRGGQRPMGATIGNGWTMSAWVYRPSNYAGGAQDRISVENGDGDGYGVQVIHGGSGGLRIERRTNGSGSNVASTGFNPPEDQWFRVELVRSGSSVVASAYNGAGTLLATVSGTNSQHSTFSHVALRGGWDYIVDDLAVTVPLTAPTLDDRVGAADATATGPAQYSVGGLLIGDADAALGLGGGASVPIPAAASLDAAAANRSVVAWIDLPSVAGRQVIWAQGTTTRGMVLYVESATLHARAWSNQAGWGTPLEVAAPLTAGRHGVAVVLNTSAASLGLFVDGVARQVDEGASRSALAFPSASASIGAAQQALQYHDGVAGAAGTGLTGTVDDVSVHSAALSPVEVGMLYGAGS